MLDIAKCPTCGRPYHISVAVGRRSEKILAALRERPRGLTREELCTTLYAADINGGPDNAYASLRVLIHNMRKQLQPFGWTIRSSGGPGARYRLEAL